MAMQLLDSPETARAWSQALHADGKILALVPTMGALHAGHLSLIERAREVADAVVVSIFVNPTQFGAGEDFTRYPRMPEADSALAAEAGADAVYSPSAETMYPRGFATSIHPGPPADRLCGAFRPGHFSGVLTVVAKLLNQMRPEVAIFGEKDFQQLFLIRQMVRDLNIDCEILGAPIIREADGLALSSRNRYLSGEERHLAPMIIANLHNAAKAIVLGGVVKEITSEMARNLQAARIRRGGLYHPLRCGNIAAA